MLFRSLTTLTAAAFHDISHLLRPGHLQQLRNILDDAEASPNDKYVALELLKNANISAGGVLPVTRVDGQPVGDGAVGPVTQRMVQTYWDWHHDPRHRLALEDVAPPGG